MSPDVAEITPTEFDGAFNPQPMTTLDTFSIQDLERDPFLGTLSSSKRQVPKPNANQQPKTPENIPTIAYNGILRKQSTSDQVFVVSINNQQFLLKKGQVADSVKLLKGNEDEITMRYHNKNLNIKRQ